MSCISWTSTQKCLVQQRIWNSLPTQLRQTNITLGQFWQALKCICLITDIAAPSDFVFLCLVYTIGILTYLLLFFNVGILHHLYRMLCFRSKHPSSVVCWPGSLCKHTMQAGNGGTTCWLETGILFCNLVFFTNLNWVKTSLYTTDAFIIWGWITAEIKLVWDLQGFDIVWGWIRLWFALDDIKLFVRCFGMVMRWLGRWIYSKEIVGSNRSRSVDMTNMGKLFTHPRSSVIRYGPKGSDAQQLRRWLYVWCDTVHASATPVNLWTR